MNNTLTRRVSLTAVVLAALGLALSQAVRQNRIFNISGHQAQAPVVELNGRAYVDVEELARITDGSLSFNGNQIVLTLAAAEPAAAKPGFSRGFLRAGIETMSVVREWRTAIVTTVQNGYPFDEYVMGRFQEEANRSLKLASLEASTDSDRSANQLLSNELDKMQKLNASLLSARKNMKYVPLDALKNEPLDQQILDCARSLGSMAANGQFQDDGNCH